MEKRVVIALALSFAVLGLYPLMLEKFYPSYYKNKTVSAKAPARPAASSSDGGVQTLQSADAFMPADDAAFGNDKLRLVFNAQNGGIREVSFGDFTDSETKRALEFFSLKTSEAAATAVRLIAPAQTTPVRYQGSVDTQGATWTSSSAPAGLRIDKRYRFGGGYDGTLELEFHNTSSAPVSLQYEIFAGSRIPPRHSIDAQYIETNFYSASSGKAKLRHIKETGRGKEVKSEESLEWLALKDRHFSVILKPKGPAAFTGLVRGLGDHKMSASLVSTPALLPAGGSLKQEFLVYIGPNRFEDLQPLGLDALVNFGKLDGIGKVLVGALELLNKLFKNYGLSIIALTAAINLLLFPLTRQSMMSMKRMQLIQPQMNKLREQHKKNPEKLNREMMELYKRHKVNPFGGCLPMILQMPVFMALYVALSKSVALIDAKFLWVTDLSSPDRVLLPFSLPFVGAELHVLPIVMTAAMFVQQRLTQVKMEGQDPAMEQQQKMMTMMMPVMFLFIFYSMPSGLVVYWLTNTILMSTYQLHLKRIKLSA